ncbi:dynein intermediate chain 2, ciliary [Anastrepha ludens]|uniref:dynein intermediate chain 2, ciliary n=1 Tax=Anastrepha ludens TaxID=28586 RepID=UPI0023AEE2BB|nr:dynein intermediate chain 2, ciliary [Anastrepha ludens]
MPNKQQQRFAGGGGDKRKTSKMKIKSTSKSNLKDGGGDADDLDAWIKSRQLLKPDDQLDLTEAELGEEITKVLTPTNTNVVRNLMIYSFKESAFVQVPIAGNTVTLMQMDGSALHIDSEEAKIQMEEMGEIGYPLPALTGSFIEAEEVQKPPKGEEDEEDEGEEKAEAKAAKDMEEELPEEEVEGEEEEVVEEGATEGEAAAAEDGGDVAEAATAAPAPGGRKRKLLNQFNFCERSALTYTNPRRNVDTQTIPPPRSQYGANVLQWNIYDSYAEDFEQQQKEKEKKDEKKHRKDVALKKLDKAAEAEILNKKYLKAWQILERMINQNIYEEIANDYRYWEDPADEYREQEGTLLPLWKFNYDRIRKLSVTDLLFNPKYYDLFAVCYGSHEFMKQPNEGAICFFTVKNPSYPDYIISTESGVMCCDIHPVYPFLVAIGMYDGSVAVYNLRDTYDKPLYLSVGVHNKHEECAWEIKWGPDMADGEINFYSVSTDGRVFNWVLMQNDFMITTITTLCLTNGIVEGPDGTEVQLRSCGSCMKFHPTNPEIYLIGTEEGLIQKCSIAYSSKYLMTYNAHHLTVYRIDFNRFNANIFISCSGDWRVKVWEDMRAEPLFIFDLGSSVGDVKWAPFSSTVFAACTTEGKVFVFDLNVNKYKPICVQAVVPKRKNKLTRLAFNENLPFIIVGDDKSTVTSVKLSPNLRLMVKPPKKQQYLDQNTLQVQKLDKLLSLVRELPSDMMVPDTPTTTKS